ncbi:hypothetical protein D7I39_11095 [Allopusillimonas ginsengisoli]|nr:hypothetical protein D7I39_11095 [Allopusillimonas ginsengisoli]
MHGFFVLGVTKQRIDDLVTRRLAAQERRLKRPPKPESTEARRRKILAKIEAKPPRTVISHGYSAPQFCRDFIALAEKNGFAFMVIARKGNREIGEAAWEPCD